MQADKYRRKAAELARENEHLRSRLAVLQREIDMRTVREVEYFARTHAEAVNVGPIAEVEGPACGFASGETG